MRPRVHADLGALVDRQDHVLVVGRVDPHVVEVGAAGRAGVGLPGLAGIGGAIERRLRGEEDVGVARIHDHVVELAAADQARIVGGARPMLAAIVGAEHALRHVIVNALALGARRHRQRDGSEVAARQAVRAGLLPGGAFVAGAIDLRIGRGRGHRRSAAAASAPPRPPAAIGPRAGVDVLRIVGIEDQPHAARPAHRAAPISRSCRHRWCASRRCRRRPPSPGRDCADRSRSNSRHAPASATRSQCAAAIGGAVESRRGPRPSRPRIPCRDATAPPPRRRCR